MMMAACVQERKKKKYMHDGVSTEKKKIPFILSALNNGARNTKLIASAIGEIYAPRSKFLHSRIVSFL